MEHQNKQTTLKHSPDLQKLCGVDLANFNTCESVNTAVVMTLESNLIRINDFIRSDNIDVVGRYVISELSDFCAMLPPQRSATPEAVLKITKTFIQHPDVKNLSVTELKTFLSLALKRMKYGKLYAGFGYDTLLEWFEQFNSERMQSIVEYREGQHAQYTASEKIQRNRNYGDEWGVNQLNEIINKNENEQE